jgi:hypothetical protein
MTKLDKGRKNDRIVKDKIITEKIIFRGEKITRERVEKVWNIPKVITNDIGFQLMFGFDSPTMHSTNKFNGINEYRLDK